MRVSFPLKKEGKKKAYMNLVNIKDCSSILMPLRDQVIQNLCFICKDHKKSLLTK